MVVISPLRLRVGRMTEPTTSTSTITTVIQIKDYGLGKYELKEIESDLANFLEYDDGDFKRVKYPLPLPGFEVWLLSSEHQMLLPD